MGSRPSTTPTTPNSPQSPLASTARPSQASRATPPPNPEPALSSVCRQRSSTKTHSHRPKATTTLACWPGIHSNVPLIVSDILQSPLSQPPLARATLPPLPLQARLHDHNTLLLLRLFVTPQTFPPRTPGLIRRAREQTRFLWTLTMT